MDGRMEFWAATGVVDDAPPASDVWTAAVIGGGCGCIDESGEVGGGLASGVATAMVGAVDVDAG